MAAPRLSVSMMAEYMKANSARRKRIILNAKQPLPFIVSKYGNAREAAADYLSAETLDLEQVAIAIEALKVKRPKSETDGENIKLCIEALNRFLKHAAVLDHIEGLSREKGPQQAKKLTVGALEISVQPEIILRKAERGKQVLGAVKFHIKKSGTLSAQEGTDMATMLKLHLEDVKAEDEVVMDKYCFVFDVFTGQIFKPARALKRKLQEITAASEEIAMHWYAAN